MLTFLSLRPVTYSYCYLIVHVTHKNIKKKLYLTYPTIKPIHDNVNVKNIYEKYLDVTYVFVSIPSPSL